ncbi:MAG TPA: flagellar hook-length control protein FliK [Methylophilus sp.]
MLPIPSTLSPRFTPHEAESVRAVASILPLDSIQPVNPQTATSWWNRLPPGTQFSALILQKEATATDPAGLASFKVQLNLPNQPPTLALMQLPANLLPQQALQMQFLAPTAHLPQVRWSAVAGIAQAEVEGNQGVQGRVLDTGTTASMLPAALPASASLASDATQVDLSQSARSLTRWLGDRQVPGQGTPLQAQQVVSLHPEDPRQLAQDLRQALDRSGLFYESHLKEAALGSRPWTQLLQEPQNRPHFMPAEMAAQQLQVLEQQRMLWQGEVWPGQRMQWQVSQREEEAASPAADNTGSVQSTLKLQLPSLGEVEVHIGMQNGHFSLRLQAGADDTARRLRLGQGQLLRQMQAAGLPLSGLQVLSQASATRQVTEAG